MASSNEDTAKEAARAVRKEIKHSQTDVEKIVAAKIWLLGCMDTQEKGGFRSKSTSLSASWFYNLANPARSMDL